MSDRKQRELAAYRELKELLAQHWTHCARCERPSSDLDAHHPYLRGSGKALWKLLTVIPVCRECHNFIHDNPNLSRSQGWLVKTK